MLSTSASWHPRWFSQVWSYRFCIHSLNNTALVNGGYSSPCRNPDRNRWLAHSLLLVHHVLVNRFIVAVSLRGELEFRFTNYLRLFSDSNALVHQPLSRYRLLPHHSGAVRNARYVTPTIFSELMKNRQDESGMNNEKSGDGASWSKLFTTVTPDSTMTVGYALIMMIVCFSSPSRFHEKTIPSQVTGILFMFLTWYIEAIHPGGEGVPQPLYFFVLVSV